MNDAATFRILDLPGGTLVPFASMPGQRVRILYGRIWLTEQDRVDDSFLNSGQEVALVTSGLAVIEALGPARIQLFEPVPVSHTLMDSARRAVRRLGAWWLRTNRRLARAPARSCSARRYDRASCTAR